MFPTLYMHCRLSHYWSRLHVTSLLARAACFPAIGADCMFSRSWHVRNISVLDTDWLILVIFCYFLLDWSDVNFLFFKEMLDVK